MTEPFNLTHDLAESVWISDYQTKDYKFTCSNYPMPCKECIQRITNFITQDLEKAEEHSRRNEVAMWISKD